MSSIDGPRVTVNSKTYSDNITIVLDSPFCSGKAKQHQRYDMKMLDETILRDKQKPVINQAQELLIEQGCVQLALKTGFGKSVLGMYLASRFQVKTCFIIEQVNTKISFENTFKKFGIPYHVWKSGDGLNIDVPLTIVSIQTLNNNDEEKFPYDSYGMLIVDENITMCTQIRCNNLLKFKPQYMVGLCADTKRKDGMHKVFEHFWGPRKNFIVEKHQGKFPIYLFNTEHQFDVDKFVARIKLEDWDWLRERYIDSVIDKYQKKFEDGNKFKYNIQIKYNYLYDMMEGSRKRLDQIVGLVHMFLDRKIIIFNKRVNTCEELKKRLDEQGIKSVNYSGKAKNAEDAPVFITTFSKCGRGFDPDKTLKNYDGRNPEVAIFTYPIQEPEQPFGRVLRSDRPEAVFIVDDTIEVKKHWDKARVWLESRDGYLHSEHDI